MLGIDFHIANTEKEAASSERYVKFAEKLHDYLLEKESKSSFDLLLDLDPYGDRLFSVQEIKELIKICEDLLNKYKKGDKNEQEVRRFARGLKELCLEALKQAKLVFAAGD
ncbi:hypothetical protein [Priestia megaterium]|uniref:hypothetical protein n=1 Tax=Priestia megaterium TaxID=1404 RepID=UPI003008A72E